MPSESERNTADSMINCFHSIQPSIISISYTDILNEVIRQSAEDFRGIRAVDPSKANVMNAGYDDIVVTPDDRASVEAVIVRTIPELYQQIRGYTPAYLSDENGVSFTIECGDCNGGIRIEELIRTYFIQKVLSWWYQSRITDFAVRYEQFAEKTKSDILSVIIPKLYERKLRVF